MRNSPVRAEPGQHLPPLHEAGWCQGETLVLWLVRVQAMERAGIQGGRGALWDPPSFKSPLIRRKDIISAHSPPWGGLLCPPYNGSPPPSLSPANTLCATIVCSFLSPSLGRQIQGLGQRGICVFFTPGPKVATT